MTPDAHPEELIGLYLAGELSPDVANEVRAYIDAHPGRKGLITGLRTAVRGERFATLPDHDRSWPKLLARLDADQAHGAMSARASAGANAATPDMSRVGKRTRYPAGSSSSLWQRQGLFRAAWLSASALVLIVLATFMSRTEQVTSVAQHYRTAPGQRSTIQLADGSVVMLAPATSLTVTSNDVTVKGEAYFQIVAKSVRPFVVKTHNAVVQVLGTTFSVRQYADESQSRVIVEAGKVAIQGRQRARRAVVSAGMLALVTDSGATITESAAARDYTAWTHGLLVFRDVPIQNVVTELARVYAVDIRVADSVLAKREMTMEFPVDEKALTRILDLIGTAVNAHYTYDGRVYVLVPGRRTTQGSKWQRFPHPEKRYGQ